MAAEVSILLAIHALNSQGQNILGDAWTDFLLDLQQDLAVKGKENPASTEGLLLFHFIQPDTACITLLESLARLKQVYEWKENVGPLPLHIVLHLEKEGDPPCPVYDATASFWDLLQYEQPYVTRPLKQRWSEGQIGENLVSPSFTEASNGLYLLSTSIPEISRVELFPHRSLPLAGPFPPCFYCGMTTHKPAICPGKMLTMTDQGISLAGYLPLETLSELFGKAMSVQEKLANMMASGTTVSQILQNQLLQVYLAYFDLNLIYQPRFLLNIAFNSSSKWEELAKPDTVSADRHSLHLGLDCLRVGQHAQAEDLFVEECRRPKGKQFYATIGRAFVALELERDNDLEHFLEHAAVTANSDKEKIYISLLQARYYALHDDPWKAGRVLDTIFSLRRDLAEALFRQAQLMVQGDLREKGIRQLRALIADRKELFLAALMDPQLLAVAGPIEDLIAVRLQVQRQEAEENLLTAQSVCHDLQSWFPGEEGPAASLLADLVGLEKQFAQGSYYDLIDVAHKTQVLLRACYRLQESTLDAMHADIVRMVARWEGFRRYWQTYPYQSFFENFQEILKVSREKLSETERLAKQNMHGQLYQTVQERLTQIKENCDTLKLLSARMAWVKTFCDGAKVFGKKLLITEIVLLAGVALLFPVLAFWLGGNSGGMVELLTNAWLQKQVLLVVTIFVAPLFALAQTLWQMMDTA
ncbi:MAG: hypothetical protein OEV89_01290 [Desulfobulbaceae bacterium]|nr:hypothetical protein [Desulfobulbaceae bacterium]HIJ89480.1 hypothetical protein [Deltaproteobacteria bacterium]